MLNNARVVEEVPGLYKVIPLNIFRRTPGVFFGGVIVSYLEWSQNLDGDYWTEEKVLDKLRHIIINAYHAVRSLCAKQQCRMRKSAYHMAIKRTLNAERLRGTL